MKQVGSGFLGPGSSSQWPLADASEGAICSGMLGKGLPPLATWKTGFSLKNLVSSSFFAYSHPATVELIFSYSTALSSGKSSPTMEKFRPPVP